MEEEAQLIIGVKHSKTRQISNDMAVKNNINSLMAKFIFETPDWDGTTKTAVFIKGNINDYTTQDELQGKIQSIIMTDDEEGNCECPIPQSILFDAYFDKEGISIGVFGQKDDFRIVTNWQYYRLENGCYLTGSIPDPPPSIYEQIMQTVNDTKIIAQSVRTDADNGEFDGVGIKEIVFDRDLPNRDKVYKVILSDDTSYSFIAPHGKDVDEADVILYTPQNLTEAQKLQVRTNIGSDVYTDEKIKSLRYVHKQVPAASDWVINHKLGCYPQVTVIDSAGEQCFGNIKYLDENKITIHFNGAFQGTAYLVG